MAKTKNINGYAITATVFGLILVYSGIKGIYITTAIRDLIAGKNPADEATQRPILGDSTDAASPIASTPSVPSTGGKTVVAPGTTKGGIKLPPIIVGGAKSGGLLDPTAGRPPLVAPPPTSSPTPLHTSRRIAVRVS